MFVPQSMNQPRGRDGKLTVTGNGEHFRGEDLPVLAFRMTDWSRAISSFCACPRRGFNAPDYSLRAWPRWSIPTGWKTTGRPNRNRQAHPILTDQCGAWDRQFSCKRSLTTPGASTARAPGCPPGIFSGLPVKSRGKDCFGRSTPPTSTRNGLPFA